MSTQILVVDDEKELADVLELYLTNDGYTVHKCHTGADALDCMEHADLDLALLDVMLPDADGFQLCKKIREKSYCPIIMLTARGADGDMIMGLTIGADDYITKPFNPLEVVARVKTQLRRYRLYNGSAPKQEEPAHEYDIRGLVLNRDSHKCFLFGREVQLTPLEFSILWYLCERQGVVVPSEELFEAVWGEKFLKNNNTVMAYAVLLRGRFANGMVALFQNTLGMDYNAALRFYERTFRSHMDAIILLSLLLVAAGLFYFYLRWLTRYFEDISKGLDALLQDVAGEISLPPELLPIERKMNLAKS